MAPIILTASDRARFYAFLERDPETGCLLYGGARNPKGYGRFALNGVMQQAHRVAWVAAGNEITEAKPHVLHNCPCGTDNPACCDVTHLWAGTNADNVADRVRKNRSRRSFTGLPFGVSRLRSGRFQSRAKVGARTRQFGSFDTWQEASAIAFAVKNLHLYSPPGEPA